MQCCTFIFSSNNVIFPSNIRGGVEAVLYLPGPHYSLCVYNAATYYDDDYCCIMAMSSPYVNVASAAVASKHSALHSVGVRTLIKNNFTF